MSKGAYVEMKIKEKGLKGKAAIVKRDHITRKGFDAFREMDRAAEGKDSKSGKKGPEKSKAEIFVEFFGTKLRVLEADGGSVAAEDVPRVRGSALRFVGCAGEVSFDEIKRPLKERFARAPFVKFTKGDDAGLVGFDKALDEDDIAFVREKIPMLNGKPITWELPEGMLALRFVLVCSSYLFYFILQKKMSTHLELSGPTRRPSVRWGAQRIPEEGAGAVELAEGEEVVAAGEIAGGEETKGRVATIANRMAGTHRQARSGRGPWNRTAETMPGCVGKWYPPSCRPLHQKSQRRMVESREFSSWRSALKILLLVAIKM